MKTNHRKCTAGKRIKASGSKKISIKILLIISLIVIIPLLFSIDAQGAPRKTSFGDPDKIDLLIVHNGKKFDRETFFGIFKRDDIVYSEYLLKDESEVFEDISDWNYDVILLYNMTQNISPKRQENFVRLLKEKGIGLVVLHHAQAAFQSWHEYHQIIGTAYIYFDVEIDGKLWPHGKVHEDVNIPIKVVDDRHPITRGMKDFEIIDETFMGRWWTEGNHVLLTTNHPENDEPVAWTRNYGKSRVFNIQLGHGIEAHKCPEFRELLVRGVRWTAGVKQSSDFSPRNTGMKSTSADGKTLQSTSSEIVKDADGNIYHTVKIGNQVWTVENLRTTKFNDGTPIPNVAADQQWKTITTPGYCYYENNPEHAEKYGILYNWYAASSRKIAPKGWRVPTHADQIELRDYLIANGYNFDGTTVENKIAKSMATKTGWIYKPTNEGGDAVSDLGTVGKNPETNNRTGFSGVPSGSRWNDGSFHALGTSQYWWSSTPYNDVNGYMSSVHTWFAKYGDNNHKKRSGFSIRLIRDENNEGSNAASMIPESFGDPDKIDVLVVTGGLGIDRDQFFALFNGRDEFNFVEYPLKDESEVFEDISDWKYDVLLLYNATQEISQKRRDNFVSLLKDKGVGLVVVHHAQAAFQNWLEFHKINGSAFIYYDVKIDGNTWPHSKSKGGMDIPVTIFDKEHPITRGLTNFRVLDETYKGRWWAKDNHVLLTTSHPENDEPIAWTRQYGKSRVFNIQLGHDYHTYEVPQYRDLIIRGIFWTDGAQEGPGSGDSVGESTETVKDADGNIYHTVKIGNQLWTVENLKTTRYNDGTPIPNITKTEEWKSITTPGYCNYENNPENGKKYGILYNWYAASSDKIAPKGWRVPTLDEQIAFMDYLIANGYNYDGTKEGNKIGKSIAAKTDWNYKSTNEGNKQLPDIGTVSNNPETNNRSGFSALPAGSRWNDGSFHSIGESVYWWSSTPASGDDAHLSFIKSWLADYGFIQHHKRSGFCIRLVRDLDVKEGKKDGLNLSTPGNTATMNLPTITINDIRKGLVAYWPLDNLSTTTPDLSGNRNHLQAINLTAADVVSGKKGNAISFNGINSLLLCFTANGSGLPACLQPACTVAMWVKGSTSNNTGRVFSETTNVRSPMLAISTDSRAPEGVVDLYMRADNDNTLVSHHRTSLVAFDNAWHHIAWVDDRGNPRIYVDGVLDTNSCTYTHQPITPTITALGGVMRYDTVRFAFKGLIDEAAIWSRALTETEIRSVMTNGLDTQPNTTYKSAFGDPDKIDVLVVTGGLGIDRDQFFNIFDNCKDIKCVEFPLKDESEVFEDISNWKYDVLLLYNATQEISEKRRNNFVSLLKDKGIGLVVVHHAQAAFQSWHEFHKINGSAFIYYDVKIDGNTWPHSKSKGGMDIPVTIFDKEHPITRGLTDFRVLDETYKGRWWAKDNQVLLTTSHPENDEPVAWTRQYGRSHVFNIQLGHDYHAYDVPQYREMIIRGIRWTAGTIK